MASQTQIMPSPTVLADRPTSADPSASQWNLAVRILFRFCFVYFGLYCLVSQIFQNLVSPGPLYSIPTLESLTPTRQVVIWFAAHVFRVAHPQLHLDSGSGDQTFFWVEMLCLLLFSGIVTLLWSFLDRRRQSYTKLYKWFRVFIRFALASQMVLYGIVKVFPSQMPFPYLYKLLQPLGHFSPMGILWSSIGASKAYEIFAGSAEMLGGVLLLVPRTTMFGALICLADLTNVFVLNMTYDVPVKLLSFHLLLLSLFLLAPDFRMLVSFLLRRSPVPSPEPQLFRTRRANRISLAAQLVFAVFLVGMTVWGGWDGYKIYGNGKPHPSFYGIWDVAQLSINGQVRSPLLTDSDRWRRVTFEAITPPLMVLQRMDDSVVGYEAAIDVQKKTIALTKGGRDYSWKGNLTYQQPSANSLVLDGELNNQKIHMQLNAFDLNKFLLVSRGFHWINEYPFNR